MVSLTIARWPLCCTQLPSQPCYLHHPVGRHCSPVWPDGTLEAREGRHTQQVSLVGAEAISVDYQGDDLPTIHFRKVLLAQETAVTVRDRLGKTTQVSIRWAIPLEAKQQLEEAVAGFVGKRSDARAPPARGGAARAAGGRSG